jgi:hypothetical protein
VKRRRRFATRTIYNVLGGALAAGFLVWFALGRKTETEEARVADQRVKGTAQTLNANHRAAQQLVEENGKLRSQLAYLRDRAVPLDGTLATLRVLAEVMPQDFWIAKLETTQESIEVPGASAGTPAAKVSRRIVKVELKGLPVSSTDIDAEISRLNESLTSKLPVRGTPVIKRTDGFSATFVFDFQQGP